MQLRTCLGIQEQSRRDRPAEQNCRSEPHASRDLWNRWPDPCRRWNQPVIQVPTFLDSIEDAPVSTLRYFDSWAHSRFPEGLPNKRLFNPRPSPLSRVKRRLASSTTPISRPTRYHSTQVQEVRLRPSWNPGPDGPAPRIPSTGTVNWSIRPQCGRSRSPNRSGSAGNDLPDWPWTNQVLQLRKGNSKSCLSPFDQ